MLGFSSADAQVIGGFLVLVVILVNFFISSATRRADRIADTERRAREKVERDATAIQIKQDAADAAERVRVEVVAQTIRIEDKLTMAAKLADTEARLRHAEEMASVNAQHMETRKQVALVQTTAENAVAGADKAYTEANHANLKIADTNKGIEGLQAQLKETIQAIPTAAAGAKTTDQMSLSRTPDTILVEQRDDAPHELIKVP